ncbi:MAG: hypothetical protein F4X11_04420 [Acidobacteria bacterium]|nr:hypothetical protein [Acidobacteriota bacterium]
MKQIGVILVHGIGNQRRYDFLKEFTSHFLDAVRQSAATTRLVINKVELARPSARPETSSDVDGRRPAGSIHNLTSLFRPTTLVNDSPDRPFAVRIYEAYWADEDRPYSRAEKLKYNLWLITLFWNPIFNLVSGKYKGRMPFRRFLRGELMTLVVFPLYHLLEFLFLLLDATFRSANHRSSRWNAAIYEYAGDVKLFVSQRIYFHNQTKRDAIRARFDEVLIKACLENEEIHVVGHSLGSAVALDGLTHHKMQPSKMAEDFLAWLAHCHPEAVEVNPLAKLKTFVTLGSPLDKLYFFWPSQKPRDRRRPVTLRQRQDVTEPAADVGGSRASWSATTAHDEEERAPASWFNFSDVVDPIGADLDDYGDVEGLAKPTNRRLVACWSPTSGHTRYWENVDIMRWIAARICSPEENAPLPKQPSYAKGATRVLLTLFLLGLPTAFALALMLFGILDFMLGFAHDLYMNAESQTAFETLDWFDGTILWVRSSLRLQEGAVTVFGRLVFVALGALLIAFPFSLFHWRRNEQKVKARRDL